MRNQGGVVVFEVYDPEDTSGPRGRFLSLIDAERAAAFQAESRDLDRAAARPARVGVGVATVEHPGDGSLGGVVRDERDVLSRVVAQLFVWSSCGVVVAVAAAIIAGLIDGVQ